nr:MAG TPA: hypothetical protein [Caudoviricetes sp.]
MSKFIILAIEQYHRRLLFLNRSISRLHLGLRLKIFCFQILQMLARLFAPVSYLVDGKVGTLLM